MWRDHDTYCARRVGEVGEPEVCLAVDLFEVIAELAGLDLESDGDADEAVRLAEQAQQQLRDEESDERSSEASRRTS